jgi:alkanesulfonate monooxygenase SsuD/methylene tetrahydromethanopterin reductase-like flavin-dependent oxidoreductase (luciferase family)
MGRGFGVSAAVADDVVAGLAHEAEQLGYTSFWANDIPSADGLASLAAAASRTNAIALGVGVIPLDTRSPAVIAEQVRTYGLPHDRLLLGVGSGAGGDALERVRRGVGGLRSQVASTIVVGALGPKMIELAGEVADGVLLNWMTPEYVAHCGRLTRAAAARANRPAASLMCYVRCGLTPGAAPRLEQELAHYDGVRSFDEHVARMGVDARDACLLAPDADALQRGLARFQPVLDETIVRAITATDELDDLLALLRACAPVRT